MNLRRALQQIAVHVWAAPNTLLGLSAGAVVLCLGGRLQIVRGTAEFSGGWLGSRVGSLPGSLRFSAITLGHVILGISEAELAAAREHEHVHIRQYELWGPLFLFAYASSSIWQFVNGRSAYRDNHFERQAYATEAGTTLRPTAGHPASGP